MKRLLILLLTVLMIAACQAGGGGGGDDDMTYEELHYGETNGRCGGCCSHHGGVVGRDGYTMCADGTGLSDTCFQNGCYIYGYDKVHREHPPPGRHAARIVSRYDVFYPTAPLESGDFIYQLDELGWVIHNNRNAESKCHFGDPPSISPVQWGLEVSIESIVDGATLDKVNPPNVEVMIDGVWVTLGCPPVQLVDPIILAWQGYCPDLSGSHGKWEEDSGNCDTTSLVTRFNSIEECMEASSAYTEELCKKWAEPCVKKWVPSKYTITVPIDIYWEADSNSYSCNNNIDLYESNNPFPNEFYRVQGVRVNGVSIDLSDRMY